MRRLNTDIAANLFSLQAILFLGCALIPTGLHAQGGGPLLPEFAPGDPASSYALSGIDNINYYNGSLNIHVPVAAIGARGAAAKCI